MSAHITPGATESTVLDVLAGTPLEQVAGRHGMEPAELAEAVEIYRAAGRAGLDAHARERDWFQVRIRFSDWNAAEKVAAAHLRPRLQQARDSGVLADWWFIRKYPCWRLRCRPGTDSTVTTMKPVLSALLDELVTTGALEQWWESIYEPEALTFGGTHGMDIAHRLFHADSCGFLDHMRHVSTTASEEPVGRREVSFLLCCTLFRHSRLDAPEQADVWHRVEQARPLHSEADRERLLGMVPALQRLMATDTTPASALFGTKGPLAFDTDWVAAFAQAGHELAESTRDGLLQRGLRGVLASHVIFHWNRLGLPTRTQAILARAAREAVMNPHNTDLGQ